MNPYSLYAKDSPTWNETQLDAFQAVLDEFQQFDNTAGVFVGNEVLTRGKIIVRTVTTLSLTDVGQLMAPRLRPM